MPLAESCHFGPRRSVAPGRLRRSKFGRRLPQPSRDESDSDSPWEEDAVEGKTAGGDAGLPPAGPPVLPRWESPTSGPWPHLVCRTEAKSFNKRKMRQGWEAALRRRGRGLRGAPCLSGCSPGPWTPPPRSSPPLTRAL